MGPGEESAREPDRELFVRLLVRHDHVIRAYLRGLLPTATDVDEVMQEASVVAWRKFGELDDPDNFRRWACVIARYEVLMYRRKKARDRFVLGEDVEQIMADEGIEELSLRERQLEALDGCLGKMPDDRRGLVLRIYAAESSMKTVAAQVGKSPEAVYKALSRARRELLRCVELALVGGDQ